MEYKTFAFEVKNVETKATGEAVISGFAATFGNVDLGNDMVQKGAFKKTIREKGGAFPLLWQHDTHEPMGVIELSESKDGLSADAFPNMESFRGPGGYSLAKQGALGGFSIGYEPIKYKYEMLEGKEVRVLTEIKLYEVSLVTFPMDPKAEITAIKAELAQGPDAKEAENKSTETTEPEPSTLPEQPLTLKEIKCKIMLKEAIKEIRNGRGKG